MPNLKPFLWASALVVIALLNIVEVLPDWTTWAAVLTLPFFACATGMRCGLAKGRGE